MSKFTQKIELKTVLLAFLAALSFRVVLCLLFAKEIVPGSDQMQEIMLGQNFASGDFYGVLDTYWAPFYPFLIGLVSFFTTSPIIPAVIVSAVAGSLTAPLTYVLARQSYPHREALAATALAVFFPHLLNSLFAVGSENVYMALILGVLIVAWKAMRDNSIFLSLIAGIILGLAYLTRPEAIGYPIYFVSIIFIYNFLHKRSLFRDSLPQAGVLLLAFSLLAAPYILYLRSETGVWTISGKTQINALMAKVGDSPDLEELDPSLSHKPARVFLKYFLLHLVEANKVFPVLFPLFLFMFIGVGLFRDAWGKERTEREIYLILFCIVTLVGYASAVIQLRYFLILLPIFFCWTGRGIVIFSEWLYDTLRGWSGGKAFDFLSPGLLAALTIGAIYLYVLPLNLYMASSQTLWKTQGYEERDAGLWLKQNSKGKPYVFSASRRPVFYAEGIQMPPQTSDIREIVADIKAQKVEYVITSERSLKRNPYLKELDAIMRSDPDFALVYDKEPVEGYRISIFKSK